MKSKLFLSSAALALAALVSCGNKSVGIKVGLICLHDKNSTYDANFINAFNAACNDARKQGLVISSSVVTDVPESEKCFDAAERFVKQGYSIIFSDSYGHDKYMKKAAQKYPNVFFSSATGDLAYTAGLNNFHNAFASIYEGRYLAGVAAGQYLIEQGHNQSEKVQLGYVGAFPYAEVVSGYTSWYLGVKSIFENAEMVVNYTYQWYDYDLEAAAAERLIKDNHCILISQHADSMGAPNTCKVNNIPNVSYNINTVDMDKKCEDTYVAHSRINWKPYYDSVLKTAVGSKVDGEDEHHNWVKGLKDASVEYNVSTKLIEHTDVIKEKAEELKNGTLHVFDTTKFTCENEIKKQPSRTDITVDSNNHLTKYEVDLKNYEDTEHESVIKDLYTAEGGAHIQESIFRSAPSFALVIDGITELNRE